MDINNWQRILKDQQRQLSNILSDCQDGPDELVLFASKMTPLLQELQEHMDAVADSLGDQSANDTKTTDKS